MFEAEREQLAPYYAGIWRAESITRTTCSPLFALTVPSPVWFSCEPLLFRFIFGAYNSRVQGRTKVCLITFILQGAAGKPIYPEILLCVRKGIEHIDDGFNDHKYL